jgi:ribosomal protein L39E
VGFGDLTPHDDGIRLLTGVQVLAGQILLLFGFAEIMRSRRVQMTEGEEKRPRSAGHEAFSSQVAQLAARKMRQNRESGAWRMSGCKSATRQARFRRNWGMLSNQ